MNNATSCNVCVFESRNKWEMAACFVVLSSSTASSLGHPLWKALYDIITHLFATKRNMWHIQKPASRMYSTALQSNPYILDVLRCHSINLMRVSCHFGRQSIVEIGLILLCCCFLTVTKYCTFKLYWYFIYFELEHPLYFDCKKKIQFSTPISTFNGLMKWHDSCIIYI